MHPPPKTSPKPIGFFVIIVHFEKLSWDERAIFPSLSGQTETRWVRGWLGLQALEVVITGEGVGVARQVAGSGVKRVKEAIVHPPGNVRE